MKRPIFLSTVLLLTAVFFSTVKAQKIASVDVASILKMMPEKKKADQQLEAYSKSKQDEIQKQAQSAQNLLKKYQEEAAKQTPQVNQQREAELQKLQEKLQQMSMTAQQDLAAKQEEAYSPIEKKFNAAVEKVAKENGWDFVFDANNPALIYKAGINATEAIKKELGL